MTMPASFDLDLLRTFVAVADTASFTRAGVRLDRTQSSVSLQIKRLEEAVCCSLLSRGSRSVDLTEEGAVLLSYARQILALADQVHARLSEPDIEGVVRFGAPEDFASFYLSDVLASFARIHPRVALEVRCELTVPLLESFAAGEFDLVLIKREPQGPGGPGTRVWHEPLVWAVGPVAIDSRSTVPLVLSPHPCVYRKRALNALEAAAIEWRVAYTSPSLAGVQAAVRAGLGATVLPRDMVPSGLRILGEQDGLPPLADTEIALLRARAGLSKAALLFADHIVHAFEGQSSK